jgi:hypothetical protein
LGSQQLTVPSFTFTNRNSNSNNLSRIRCTPCPYKVRQVWTNIKSLLTFFDYKSIFLPGQMRHCAAYEEAISPMKSGKMGHHSWFIYRVNPLGKIARGGAVVETLLYKTEGCVFYSRWRHLNYSLASSFRPPFGPGVDSASNRNDYQGYFLGGKGARCVGLTTLSFSCADCLEFLEVTIARRPKR